MNKIIIATIALVTFGGAGAAYAKQDANERAAYYETIRNQVTAPAPVTEGRNAATAAPGTVGVEPYIKQQIDANARSSR